MTSMKQLFFRSDEFTRARYAATISNQKLYVVVDRRANDPAPRLYIVTEEAKDQMMRSPLWKRMWTAVDMDVCDPNWVRT